MPFKSQFIVKLGDREERARQGAAEMTVSNEGEAWIQEVDAALQEWCQGDYVLGEHWFVQRFNPCRPLTRDSIDVAREGTDLSEASVRGFMVATQTCDIVRSCVSRPFVEVVPLVEVDEQALHEIERGRRPQYAYVPAARSLNLVADLDRVMTVEKAVVAQWQRQLGCSTDREVRMLGQALARKRVRFAFPDDFNKLVNKLQKQLSQKHDKQSMEGEALRALREIRVRAAPAWNANVVQLMFWFIRDEEQVQFEGIGWDRFLQQWLGLIPTGNRFKSVEGSVVALEDMTAKDYVESDPLDLDRLSY